MTIQNQFFNQLFSSEVVETEKTIGATVKCNNTYLNRSLMGLVNLYSNYMSKDEVYNEAMFISMEVINDFDSHNWEGILDGTDLKSMNQLFKKIITVLRGHLYEYAYDVYQVTVDGEAQFINQRFSSLNETFEDENGETYELMDTVTHSFWSTPQKDILDTLIEEESYDNSQDAFINWFLDGKDEILTDSQLDFYDAIVESDSTTGYHSDDLAEQIGRDKQNTKRTFDNIKKRAEEKFEIAKDEERYNKLKALNGITDENDIAVWFKIYVNDFSDALKAGLSAEDYKALRATLRRKNPDTDIVYLADEVLMTMYDQLKVFNEYKPRQFKKFYKKLSEYSDFDVKEALKKYKEFAQHGEVKVFKNGELIETIVPKVKEKKDRIINLTT